MDKALRNTLRNVVTQCRKELEQSVSEMLEGQFGIYPSGKIDDPTEMGHLSVEDQEYRSQLLVHLEHIQAGGFKAKDAAEQLIREVAFTHLNRFCAYKMMEVRKLIRESVSRGYESNNVKFYLADHSEDERLYNSGKQDLAYRHFLEWLGSTLSEEIGVLFSPHDPANRLLPPQRVLDEVLKSLNNEELKNVWAEDETIGWIYQYFTPDEVRRKARKDNPVPQNSYELSFRNQFYTPSYVVQFLADNTLGRIWYEMRQGETALTEQCQYLVRKSQDASISQRAKKDPRDIRVLDPACGSGHFLLYCFTLLQVIYNEAYDDPDLGEALQQEYPDRANFQHAVPGLILAHNLHGIDIDLRATQIAALALWLRAQRAYQEMGLKKERPKITKSNLVCAEPMPGEAELLQEFVAELPSEELRRLVQNVFEKMSLAGEAGSLLKIEDEIQAFVKEILQPEQLSIFSATVSDDQEAWSQLEEKAKDALRAYAEKAVGTEKLQRQLFSNDAVQGFAFIDLCLKKFDVVLMNPPFGDASQPSKPYIEEVYGDTKGDVYKTFVECFQDRLVPCGMLGIISNRTGFFLGQSSDWRERVLLRLYRPLLLADLGYGVLDAVVETAAYVLRNLSEEEDQNLTLSILPELWKIKLDKDKAFSIPTYQKHRGGLKRHQANQELKHLKESGYVSEISGHYIRYIAVYDKIKQAKIPSQSTYPSLACFRLLADEQKDAALLEAIGDDNDSRNFVLSPQSFKQVPGSPFSYWTSEKVRQIFTKLRSFEGNSRTAKQGLATADDFQFVRANWEVPVNLLCAPSAHPVKRYGAYCVLDYRWFPFVKGGEYAPYYLDSHLVVDWEKDGFRIRSFVDPATDKVKSRPQNTEFYFYSGITWSLRSASNFSPRTSPKGCIFSHKGPIAVVEDDHRFATLGILFSQPYQTLIEMRLAAGNEISSGTASRSYEVGIIQKLPWADLSEKDIQELDTWVSFIVQKNRERDTYEETTRVFVAPFTPEQKSIRELAELFQRSYDENCCEILEVAAKVDIKVAEILGVSEVEREAAFGEDAGTLCALPDRELDAEFNTTYSQSIYDTIRDELEESGGDRQIAVKSFYASRRLEVLARSLDTNPKQIARIAAERHLIPDGLQNEFAQTYLSYAMGCVFGRWDVRFATGEYPKPKLSDPFAPLPVYSPGMLAPHSDLSNYPIEFEQDGILVDDPDSPDDIIYRVRAVLELLWGNKADTIEQEICEILGVKTLRDYLRRPGKGGFWDDHIRVYTKRTKGHSKVPIYWLLQSSKKSYALWLYYHRLDKDILFKACKRLETKFNLENDKLNQLNNQREGLSGTALKKLEREIEKQAGLVSELQDFDDKLQRTAKLDFGKDLNEDIVFDPDLNDGVLLNIAPLWELVPWSEAKKYWQELLQGKYEWSSISRQLRAKGLI